MTNTSTDTFRSIAVTAMAAVLVLSAAFAGVTLGAVGTTSVASQTNTTGPLNVTFDDVVSTNPSPTGTTREPMVQFNQSRTIEGSASDELVVENPETGASVSVVPVSAINVSAGDSLELEIVAGNGTQDSDPAISLEHNDTDTRFDATVTGDFANTFTAPYANLTVTFIDDGSAVDTTDRAAIHPVDYDAEFQQNSTSGVVAVSFARDGLPEVSSVNYNVFDMNLSTSLSYNATSDRFEGTVDVSSLNESTYPAGGFFSHPDDGFYFGANGELVVNRSGSSSDGGSSGGGSGALSVTHASTLYTTSSEDRTHTGRIPSVVFDQSRTMEASASDSLRITNTDTGANVSVVPTEPVYIGAGARVDFTSLYDENGTVDAVTMLSVDNGTLRSYDVSVEGDTENTFTSPYANYTITFVNDSTDVATTPEDSLHPIGYEGTVNQTGTSGLVDVSVPRSGLPASSSAELTVITDGDDPSTALQYNTTSDAFEGTVDVSNIPNGTYTASVDFRNAEDGRYFFLLSDFVVNGSSDSGSTAAGPLSVTFDSSVSTTSSGDGTPTSSTPYVVFNQSRTLDAAGGDYLILTNTNTGANVTVTPTEPVSIDAMSEVGLDIYNGSGAIRSPRLTVYNGTWQYYDVTVSGNVSETITAPYANFTVTFVNDTTEVTTTPEDIIHPIGYLGEVRQTGTTGTIEVSVPRDGLPQNSSVRLEVRDTSVVSSLSYNASADTFEGTLDVSNLSDGTYRTGAVFLTAEDGFYFATHGDILVGKEPSVTITNQTTNGTVATIDSVYMPNGGFLAVRDDSVYDGDVFDSVIGVSSYLSAGNHSDVTVRLTDPIAYNQTVVVTPHTDSNGNRDFDFLTSEGAEDGPYRDSGGNVTFDSANVTVDLTGEPGDAEVYLEQANQTFGIGENATYLVRVANPDAAVGALNISIAPSTSGVDIVDAQLPPETEFTEITPGPNGSVQFRAAGLDTGLDDPVVAAIAVQGRQTGNGTLTPTVETLADERGLEYNVTAVSGGTYTVTRPSLTLDLVRENPETPVGERNAYVVVAEDVSGGVGALNVTFTLDNASVADLVGGDVASSTDLIGRERNVENGTETFTIRAAGMDTSDTGSVTIAGVFVNGSVAGNATITADASVVAREDGVEYKVANAPSEPLEVPPPKVGVGIHPDDRNRSVQPGETFTVRVVTNTNTLGVYGEEFTLAFNESVLNATDVSKGPFLGSDGATTNAYGAGIDNTNGSLNFGVARQDTQEPITGKGLLATVTFRVEENVTRPAGSPLDFTTVKVSDENAEPLPNRRGNGSVYVPENAPPGLNATLVSTVANEGQPVKVRAGANDTDGTVSTVALRDQNGTVLANTSCGAACVETLSATPNFHTWNGSGYDSVTVRTVAVDDDGAETVRELQFQIYTAGDANGDGIVDIFDASAVGTAWNAERGDAAYSDAADQNNDGVIDIFDASILGTNWNDEATTNSTSN